ncbi:sugar efflux transporter [Paenibacillus urinalis]|uniref:Sugar efflux transporter n=1 Tax=Paenibacillus urinalis TaxID=521520 RepID=A0ABY7X337_9BACL|nr:sugar efflux transporter [Paenibacillus urinalis]WDH96616.1 sugar efflux transporter [Paenibacillus urinalis]WDI00260.1 sugar efflux transporter [Paenibacillus urinalis]
MYKRLKNLFSIKGYGLFVICVLLVGTGISITMPYLALYYTEELGMSAGAFGSFTAFSSLSGVVANSFIGKYSDRMHDRKLIIIFATLSSALGYTSYLVFDHYLILLILVSFFSGVGAAAMPQIYAYAQESAIESNSDDKTFAMSILRTLVSFGFLIGPLIGTLILAVVGYNGLFLGTSAIFLVISSLVLLFLPKKRAVQKKKPSRTNSMSVYHKQIMYPLIAFIFLFAVNAINGIITPLFIVNELQGTHTDVGLVVSICAGLEIPIMFILGALGRKISNHSLMMAACFIAIIYNIILSVSTYSWQIIGAQLLQALFVAIIMGNGLSYFAELLPNSPGMSSTIYYNGSIIGRLVGNLGGGVIAQFVGVREVYWVCLSIAIVTVLILWYTKPQKAVKLTG